MKARAMNSKAMVAAAMMMAMTVVAARSASASLVGDLGAQPVRTSTVMDYGQGAWTGAAAVVLKSQSDWDGWNAWMVSHNMAYGAQPLTQPVDWNTQALLVVTLGENLNADYALDVAAARRSHGTTEVTLSLKAYAGGSSPCVVVAMDRSVADAVVLTNGPMAGPVPVYQTPASSTTSGNVAATWGEMKDAYRR